MILVSWRRSQPLFQKEGNIYRFLLTLILVVMMAVFVVPLPAQTSGWGWKKASDPDDVINFLGGQGAYTHPVKASKVVGVWKKTSTEYYVFYIP